ncbi:MAG: hypothetical protein R2881_07075 [Eubacteriales bacterium]
MLTAALTISLGESGIDERGVRLLECIDRSSRSSGRRKGATFL